MSKNEWDDALDANRRLAFMYDPFLNAIAERFPGCSLADMACNNGYFPLGASLRGMGPCTGIDRVNYVESIALLNGVIGTRIEFIVSIR